LDLDQAAAAVVETLLEMGGTVETEDSHLLEVAGGRMVLIMEELVGLEQREWLLSQLIFNMNNYAILDKENGWLVNIVVWDGDTEKWNPPDGTIAVNVNEIDFSTLPVNPNQVEL
jgi:hypothetical protein